MKKKTESNAEKITLSEALRLHLRALKLLGGEVRGLLPAAILSKVLETAAPYVTVFLSARIIDELSGARRPETLTFWVLLAVGLGSFLTFATRALRVRYNELDNFLWRDFYKLMNGKYLTMDFADVDDYRTSDLYARVTQVHNWGGNGLLRSLELLERAVVGVTGILCAAGLLMGLFLSPVPISSPTLLWLNSPWAVVLLIVAVLVPALLSGFLSGRASTLYWALSSADMATLGNRRFGAGHFFYGDFSRALDIRIYRQMEAAKIYWQDDIFGVHGLFARKISIRLLEACASGLSGVLTGVVYAFVCLKALGGAFGVGSITQYVAAGTTPVLSVQQLLTLAAELKANGQFLRTTFEFLDIPSRMYQGTLSTEKRSDLEYEVEFRDVSFKYPGSDRWALRHVNMSFQIGSRLALVGENGSGKSTFIKLLCRLYDPTEGEILLNGIDIKKYDYKDYMDIFSVVFQDFELLSAPLGENVAGAAQYDRARVEKALRDAGFGDRLTTLPKGLDTMLYRDLDPEGVLISGGEAQKIAIARALYKQSPFIILDEPTAALDPIAEAEIYAQFDRIAGEKTAVYISHRLSSCRFCDRIAVFSEGAVAETGTHDGLLAQGGLYRRLWDAQAQYYDSEKI